MWIEGRKVDVHVLEITRAAACVFVVHIQSNKPQAGHRIYM